MHREIQSAAQPRFQHQSSLAIKELKERLWIKMVLYPLPPGAGQMQVFSYVSTGELGKTEHLYPQTER